MIIASLLMLFGQGQTPFYSPTIGGTPSMDITIDPCWDAPVLPEKAWFCPPDPVDDNWHWEVDQVCKDAAETAFLIAAQACYDTACEDYYDSRWKFIWCHGLAFEDPLAQIQCALEFKTRDRDITSAWASCLSAAYEAFMATDCCVKVYL